MVDSVGEEAAAAVAAQAAAGDMKTKLLLRQLDDARIMAAIEDAERKTSGEIRVFISHRLLGSDDLMDRARRRFEKLRMARTRDRNAVLVYLNPREQKFAILGDIGIHEKCGDAFWNDAAAQMQSLLREGRFTDAVVETVRKAGELLANHFPPRSEGHNELPNKVTRD